MNIQNYEVFIKTAELGSFTKAGAHLGFSQSAVSHMMQALEAECGCKLLYRDRSGVRITPEGKLLLPYFKDILNAQHLLEARIQDIAGLDSGLVRIATFTSASVQWIPYIIKEFRQSYPGIEFELMYGEYAKIEEFISRGDADCGFLRLPAGKGLETTFLLRDPLVVIMPIGHALAKYDSIPATELERYPFIQLDEGSDYEIDAVFDLFHIKPQVQFFAKDDQTIVSMVSNGLGISIMPRLPLKGLPYELEIRPLEQEVYRDLGFAIKKDRRPSRAAEQFLLSVKDWIARQESYSIIPVSTDT